MYEHIGDSLPRFRVYEALFPRHEQLLAVLANAYLDIIRFSHEACKVFARPSKGTSITRSLSLKEAWKSFKPCFDQYIAEFRKHQENVAEEAKVAHMIEEKNYRNLCWPTKLYRNLMLTWISNRS